MMRDFMKDVSAVFVRIMCSYVFYITVQDVTEDVKGMCAYIGVVAET